MFEIRLFIYNISRKCVALVKCFLTLRSRLGGYIYTTKIDGVVCPPNISETVAGRLMKLAHRQCITSTTIKLISTNFLLSILSILVKTIQRIVADPKRTLSPPFDSADSVSSLGHPAPGSGNMLPLLGGYISTMFDATRVTQTGLLVTQSQD